MKPIRVYANGMLNSAHDLYVTSLLLLKLNLKDPENPEVDFTKELESNLKQYKKWAEINPANFKHKYNLILAEYARFKKEYWDASLYYDIALESASENEYNLDAGLCAELAGEFYLEQNRVQQAKKYFQTSLYYYNLCGAMAKVGHVRSLYPEYTPSGIGSTEKSSLSNSTKGTQTAYTSQTNLDIQTILRANRAISEEINLESLLKKLISIALENAGATRGILLLYNGDTLCVEAEGKKETGNIQIYSHFPVKSYTEIPDSIVQYVSKTSESILLDSALEDTQFGNNPYLQREKIQSLLCMPISSKGKNIGFLYLENSLIRAAFTKSRIDILNMIVSQGAVSIENAKLYNTLSKTNRELDHQKGSLENLNTFIRGLNESLELNVVLNNIKNYLKDKYDIKHLALGIVDSSGKNATISDYIPHINNQIKERILSLKIPIVDTIGGHAYTFLTNKPLYIKTHGKNRITPQEKEILGYFKFTAYLILPLILNGKNIGFLDLGYVDEGKYFNKEQINELSILSKQLTGII
ncbi:MAG: GAF domain-containing protein, partial [Spirochaetia bacterium]|nr:GAF domain-containing protein [Spirochaetia bacterium]